MHPRLCLQILRYAQDDKERNASFCGAENVILRAIKRRFLKSHGPKVQHWYSGCQALPEYFFQSQFSQGRSQPFQDDQSTYAANKSQRISYEKIVNSQ